MNGYDMDYSATEKAALREWAIGKGPGHHRRTCFACAATRRNKQARTLSVTVDQDKALWMCFHCDAAGGVRLAEREREWSEPFVPAPPKKKSSSTVRHVGTELDLAASGFLKSRCISEETAKHFGVVAAVAYFPDLLRETLAVAVPYWLDDRVAGHKVRSVEDKANVCDATLSSLCGIQCVDLDECGDIVICEGEFDMLAMYEAGVLNSTSVPNGSGSFTRAGDSVQSPRETMAFLWSAKAKIDKAKRIVIASDADDSGGKLADELARRIGKHRCWRVAFPADCKDANDVLIRHGRDKLKDCVERAEPWPVEGLYEARFISPR